MRESCDPELSDHVNYQGSWKLDGKRETDETGRNRVILATKSHGPKDGRGCTLHTRNNSLIFILSRSSQRSGGDGHRVLIHRTKICSLSGVYSLMNSLKVIDATTSLHHHSQLGPVIKLSPLPCVSMCFLTDSKLICSRWKCWGIIVGVGR